MQFPTPSPEHAELQELVGEWDATVTTLEPGGAASTSKGKCTYRPVGELWVVSEFEGEMGGAPFTGHGIEGYDPRARKHISLWIDSWSTEFMLFEGTKDKATRKTTMLGSGRDLATGELRRFRSVTELKDRDTMVFRMFSPGPDGKEIEMMRIDYRRRS